MKIRIGREEQYPIYYATEDNNENRDLFLAELSLEEWADYELIREKYDVWQVKLRQLRTAALKEG